MGEQIIKVVVFAVAFAYIEATVVVYLRQIFGSIPPIVKQEDILLVAPGNIFLKPETSLKIIADQEILDLERLREFATIVMLAAVASVTARRVGQRWAFFLLVFGIWDIFYYLFLALTIGWPRSLLDQDVFFLLPVPWVGPVISPLAISLLFITWSLLKITKSSR